MELPEFHASRLHSARICRQRRAVLERRHDRRNQLLLCWDAVKCLGRNFLCPRSRCWQLSGTSDDGGNDAQDCKEHARGCGYAGSIWPLQQSLSGQGAETQVADGGCSCTFADVQSELLN